MKSVKEMSSKQNFTIGSTINPVFYKETSTGAAFVSKNQAREIFDIPNLR